jgi:hypothetical protein
VRPETPGHGHYLHTNIFKGNDGMVHPHFDWPALNTSPVILPARRCELCLRSADKEGGDVGPFQAKRNMLIDSEKASQAIKVGCSRTPDGIGPIIGL